MDKYVYINIYIYVYTYNYHDYTIKYKSISYVKSCVQYLQWSACAALHPQS